MKEMSMDSQTGLHRHRASREVIHNQFRTMPPSGTQAKIESHLAEELANQLAAFFEQKVVCQPLNKAASAEEMNDPAESMLSVHFSDSSRTFDWSIRLSRSFARELLDVLYGLPSHLSRADREERFSSFELRLTRRLAHVVARSVDRVLHGGQQSECLCVELGTAENGREQPASSCDEAGWSMNFALTAKDRCGVVVIQLPTSSTERVQARCQSPIVHPIHGGTFSGHKSDYGTGPLPEGKAIFAASISAATLRVRDIADLKPGDVIATDTIYPSAIEVTVNGICKYTGTLGVSRNHKAVRITQSASR